MMMVIIVIIIIIIIIVIIFFMRPCWHPVSADGALIATLHILPAPPLRPTLPFISHLPDGIQPIPFTITNINIISNGFIQIMII